MKKRYKIMSSFICMMVLTAGLVGCSKKSDTSSSKSVKVASSKETAENKGDNKKLIIAHRGASGYIVEHTLESYSMAYGLGADYIEADVNITKDNVPVVMHDIHLDTTTNVGKVYPNRKRKDGRYYIVDFTLDEIKKLSVHERSDLKTGEAVFKNRFPKGKSHFEVPTLKEEIELIQGLNKSTGRNVGIYVEMKIPKFYTKNGKNIGKMTLDTLRKYGYDKKDAKCFIQCFDPTYLRKFKNEFKPKCKLIQLLGESSWEDCKGDDTKHMLSKEGLKEISEYADGIGPWTDQVLDQNGKQKQSETVSNPNLVKDAHENNLLVHPYTVRKAQKEMSSRGLLFVPIGGRMTHDLIPSNMGWMATMTYAPAALSLQINNKTSIKLTPQPPCNPA